MATATKNKSKAKVMLQPIGDRIVVERQSAEGRTSGGIFLPDSAKDKPSRGTVVCVGTGRLLADGTRAPMQLKAGDRVIFTSYAPEEMKVGDESYLLMREEDVLAVIEG